MNLEDSINQFSGLFLKIGFKKWSINRQINFSRE
jgi:hypothetical protein